jgi:hypothetical protein
MSRKSEPVTNQIKVKTDLNMAANVPRILEAYGERVWIY